MKDSILLVATLFAGCSWQQTTPTGDVADLISDEVRTSDAKVTMAAFNLAGDPTIAFHVPEMMCAEGCAPKVHEALAAQPGVKEVKVEFESKTATVAMDENEFDASAAVAVLEDEYGFPNTTILTTESENTDPETQELPSATDDAHG